MRRFLLDLIVIAIAIGPFLSIGAVGITFLATPARQATDWVLLSSLSALPDNGQPIRIPVMLPRYDCWNRLPDELVGAVYARRIPGTESIKVLSAMHGRFNVLVEFDPETKCFRSMCYIVRFDTNGKVLPDDRLQGFQYEDLQAFPTKVIDGSLYIRWSRLSARIARYDRDTKKAARVKNGEASLARSNLTVSAPNHKKVGRGWEECQRLLTENAIFGRTCL
jgi:hypothetical protein